MSRACDRCKNPVGKYGGKLRFSYTWRRYVRSLDEAFSRYREGREDYDDVITSGKADLCEDCIESWSKWFAERGEEA